MRKFRPIIEIPRLIDIRFNALNNIKENLESLNLRGNGILFSSSTALKVAGKKVLELLDYDTYNISTFLINTASIENVEKALIKFDELEISFVIAVGGGSVIDVAKYASFKKNIPFVSIPTVASHDGIASSRASLRKDSKQYSFNAHSPIAVIGDIGIIAESPRRFTISGCADIISNLSAVMDWELSHRITGEKISQYAIILSKMAGMHMIESRDLIKLDVIKATDIILQGLIMGSMAMCIAGSTRPASGSEHLISHSLDRLLSESALHGEQCGVSTILCMYFHGGNWQIIKDTLKVIGAPTSAYELGVTENEIINAVTTAHTIRKDRFTILGKHGISHFAAIDALNKTGII